MNFGKLKKSLFALCIVVSVLLHLSALGYFYFNPLIFNSNVTPMVMKAAPEPKLLPHDDEENALAKIERALEESLNQVIAIAKAPTQPVDDIAAAEVDPVEKVIAAVQTIEDDELGLDEGNPFQFVANLPPLFDPEKEADLAEYALDDDLEEEMLSFESEKMTSVDLSDHRVAASESQTIQDDYSLPKNTFNPSKLSAGRIESIVPGALAKLETLKTQNRHEQDLSLDQSDPPNSHLVLPNAVEYLQKQWIERSLADRKLPDLDHYGLSEISHEVEWDEDIGVDISIMPDPQNDRYIFSLILHPDFDIDTSPLSQNIYFFIDASNGERTKLSRYKRAVQRSLAALDENDKFNIVFYDKKLAVLSDTPLAVNYKNLQKAEDFLEKQSYKNAVSTNDIYEALEHIVPIKVGSNQAHSLILISDGNSLSATRQKKALANWIRRHENSVQIYSATSGKGNNLALLDVLSYSTSGRLLYSDTNAAFPRKLVRLVKDLHDPYLTNISIDIAAKDSGAKVELYPRKNSLPPFFSSRPYIVVGSVNELCDFTFFLQGRHHDHWFNVRKTVHLGSANRGGRSLEKQWASAQAKICYEQYLKSGKLIHLKQAKEIVAPYRGIIALEQ